MVEPGVVEPDNVGRDVVEPDVVGPDVVGRGEAWLGILSFWPTYTHELIDMPLAIARRCVVIPWRMAMRISVSPGRTMYVLLTAVGSGAGAVAPDVAGPDVVEPDAVGRDVVGLDGAWPGMRSL